MANKPDKLFLKPNNLVSIDPETKKKVEGKALVVRDPTTNLALGADGEWKPNNTYWKRRLRDKDVSEVKPPKEVKKVEKAKATKETTPEKDKDKGAK